MLVADKATMASTRPDVFFGGDAFGPRNIIRAVAHGHDAAISIILPRRGHRQAAAAVVLLVAEDGHPRVGYDNAITSDKRHRVPLRTWSSR
jgi:hypothetical protein